jgi:hypothetical protein
MQLAIAMTKTRVIFGNSVTASLPKRGGTLVMKTLILAMLVLLILSVPARPQRASSGGRADLAAAVKTMRTLVKFKKHRSKKNTIYFSKFETDRNSGNVFLYAYWVEDQSITSLRLPLTLPLVYESPDYWWLTTKARIDLVTDVMPTEKDIHGSSYLVHRPWVNQIKRKCRRGFRLDL